MNLCIIKLIAAIVIFLAMLYDCVMSKGPLKSHFARYALQFKFEDVADISAPSKKHFKRSLYN